MSLRTHITRHFRSEDCSIHLPYFSRVPVWPNRARMKKRHGQREDFKQENVRSDAEPFQFKVPHLAFICWIPCLLHVLAAVFTSSCIWRSHVNPKSWSSHWLFLFYTFFGVTFEGCISTHTQISTDIWNQHQPPQFILQLPLLISEEWLKHQKKRKFRGKRGVKRTIDTVSNECVQHLHRLFTPVFTQCHPQLMALTGRATYPLLGPQTLPGPLWVPNWAYHPLDWINSLVPGTFTPPARGGFIPSVPARWRRGGRSKGSRAQSCQNVSKAWPLLLAKPS